MPCYKPLSAWTIGKRPNGKSLLVFSKRPPRKGKGVFTPVPCQQCIGCRLEKSRQWAIRSVHESQLYDNNCFITLTYDDKHLPKDGSLSKRTFQLFMKRLRKMASTDRKFKKKARKIFNKDFLNVRYLHCGEYGTVCKTCLLSEAFCKCPRGKFIPSLGRPHYHACLFDFDLPDKVHYKTKEGVRLYVSAFMQKLWPYGFSTVGEVNFESAAYVARYVTKKINGNDWIDETGNKRNGAKAHYGHRLPEYATMSRRPGLGRRWLEKFQSDVYPCDNVVLRGKMLTPPKYYDRCLEQKVPLLLETIKAKRVARAVANREDNTWERLAVKETVKKAQFKLLKRGYENET